MSEVVRTLKDGYWDHTTVIRASKGTLRVRKESRDTETPGPWAHEALRNEISYLENLPTPAANFFPPLLSSWEEDTIGYEIPYYQDRSDLARLVLDGIPGPADCEEIQNQLADAVLGGLHSAEQVGGAPFCAHLEAILSESLETLSAVEVFEPIVNGTRLHLNGHPVPGLRASLARLRASGILKHLAREPSVRLHGDLILENMLWSPLLLIDPVSVAGLTMGHPLFDLVKHESYARGELYAIREELVTAGRLPDGSYTLEIPWGAEALQPFDRIDLTVGFRKEFIRQHGEINPHFYHLIDAYFSLVMARNTTGLHQFARVLKGCQGLARAGDPDPVLPS
ncbi:MAG: phosphotransferase [Roseibacillus sp.]|jgi:hypothetical protein|nr:hypothetical protein [Roseibacillus sp.]MCP4732524.1 phosphotransferase [Roseibacillus sp.]MDP7306019.1 phosphotransferase [Roseibacillus sp.]HJM65170.1 phosphotransferase [Roseibacillus sp.]|tara:strand:+ start:12622 stop:13638 length:1017 start_codon:yes stop_codon:yes gene_type:complete